MHRITGLLIDPHTHLSTVVRFAPTLGEFYRLLDTHCITCFSDLERRLCYTALDEVADEEDAIIYRKGWSYPVRGKLLITGPVDTAGNHTSLTPQQISGCRRTHRVGTLYCGGVMLLQPLARTYV